MQEGRTIKGLCTERGDLGYIMLLRVPDDQLKPLSRYPVRTYFRSPRTCTWSCSNVVAENGSQETEQNDYQRGR